MFFDIIFIILVFVIYFPLIFLGYDLYKKILARAGISTHRRTRFIDTDIGKNIKNGFLNFTVNAIGSAFVSLFYAFYLIAILGVSFFIVWQLSKIMGWFV